MKCVNTLTNDKKDGIHRMESVMNVNRIEKNEITNLMSVNGICKINTSLRVYILIS